MVKVLLRMESCRKFPKAYRNVVSAGGRAGTRKSVLRSDFDSLPWTPARRTGRRARELGERVKVGLAKDLT